MPAKGGEGRRQPAKAAKIAKAAKTGAKGDSTKGEGSGVPAGVPREVVAHARKLLREARSARTIFVCPACLAGEVLLQPVQLLPSLPKSLDGWGDCVAAARAVHHGVAPAQQEEVLLLLLAAPCSSASRCKISHGQPGDGD